MKKSINTQKLPKPVGPYSQMVSCNGFLFLSGQIAIDPVTGELIKGGVEDQTTAILEAVKSAVEEQQLSMKDVVKVTAYLTGTDDFNAFNIVYAKCFTGEPPVRITVFVNALPKGARVELDVIAALKD